MQRHQSAVMAFAAICQAAQIVKDIARYDRVDEKQLDTIIRSLTYIDASTPIEIYGGLENLKMGYQVLVKMLGNAEEKDMEVTRYILGSISLERQLAKRPATMKQLATRIDDLNRQLSHFELLDNNTMANIATIYTDVLSPLGRRIQITGDPQYLKIESNQNKVRAVLLGAVRAAVLWRQLGGKRRQLIFNRNVLVEVAEQDLRRI